MHPYFMPICSTLNSAPSQFAASSLHRQWVFTRNRTQPVQSHSAVHTPVFFKPPSCWKILKYKISPKTFSRYLRNCGNGRKETPRLVGSAGGRWCWYLWGLPVGAFVLQKCHPSLEDLDYFLSCLYLGTPHKRCILGRKFFIMLLKLWSWFL